MEAREFIRIEDKSTGRGMFEDIGNNRFSNSILMGLWDRHKEFPVGYQQEPFFSKCFGGIKSEYEYSAGKESPWRFAFKSLTQLRQWVSQEELKELVSRNHAVYRINATNYYESDDQAVFNINDVVNKEDITGEVF